MNNLQYTTNNIEIDDELYYLPSKDVQLLFDQEYFDSHQEKMGIDGHIISRFMIQHQVEETGKKRFGFHFKFRPKQKDAIIDVVYNWLTGMDNVICSAPTGSGKSIIALMAAYVLSKYYKKTGYILISDLSLIQQYERDVEKYFPEWSVIKGQHTYTCDVNGLPFNCGACKMKGCQTYSDIYKKFPTCSKYCQYIIDRKKAIDSDVVVCTYSFWLIQRNLVARKLGINAPFLCRDFTICDEAHKLTDIIQNHFSPKFEVNDLLKISDVMESGGNDDDLEMIEKLNTLRVGIKNSSDNNEIFNYLKQYVHDFKVVVDSADTIMRDLSQKIEDKVMLSKSDKNLVSSCDFVNEHYSSFSDYIKVIEGVGCLKLVKNDQEKSDDIIFNCIDESYLMEKYFHARCGSKLYMSATIGDPKEYAKNCSFKDYFYIDIPSTFDFTNSPIFYVPDFKLSYNDKEKSLPQVVRLIEATINMYTGKRGIVQTGSYQFAQYLYDNVSFNVKRRLIVYDDSKQKMESLDLFKNRKDKILVGPSLIEGLSFDDDLSRFQIVMKIPYPSLKDKFVAAKQSVYPEWYSNTTSISILQGVGRGIRNENDWCVTFIFDGCFTNLVNNSLNMYPKQFIDRVQVIKPTDIIK